MKRLSRSHAFTLIELLIVIVIIGVLAGVLLAVLRPQEQINRAKDATTKASMNKIALSIKGNISAYNRVPTGWGMLSGLSNANGVDNSGTTITAAGTYCTNPTIGATLCQFRIVGSTLPATCATTGGFTYSGDNTVACNFFYYAPDVAANAFRLIAKSWGSNYVFVYESDSGAGTTMENTYVCPSTYTYTSSPATFGGCTNSAL